MATLATSGVLSAATAAVDPAHIVRIAGPDRYATSVAISKATWQAGAAQAVVLARGDTFPDALAGGPLAGMKDGPLLITRPTELPSTIRAEIQRVLPAGKTIYLLGSTSAISSGIQSQLQSLGYLTKRLGGTNRYATAALIAREIKPTTRNIWLATGRNFPDALAAATAAAHFTVEQNGFQPHVLLLTDDATLPSATTGYIADSRPGFTNMIINTAGAQADQAAKDAYGGDDFFDIRSNVGANRYETSTKIVKQYYGTAGDVGLTNGENFPDALGASAMLAQQPFEPLLLTKPTALPGVVADYLQQIDPNPGPLTLHVFGGSSAVSGSVATAAANRMGDVPDLPDRPIPPNGQPVTLTFAADQEGALTFTAPESGHPRLTFTNSALGPCRLSMTVFLPTGDVLTGDECVGTGSVYVLDGLTSGDTARIFLDPYGSATGSVTVTLEIVQDLPDQSITPDGPPVTLEFEPGQNGALTFDAVAGTKLRLRLVDRTFDACDVAVSGPGFGYSCFENAIVIERLAEDGGHRIFFDPVDIKAGSLTVKLETIEDLPDAAIVPDGPPLSLSFEVGQDVTLHFDANAGQKMLFTASCDEPGGCGYSLELRTPDGQPIKGSTQATGVPIVFEPLDQTGSHAVFIDPFETTDVTYAFELDTIADPPDQPIVVDGPPVTLTLTSGQNGAMSFTGATGDRLRLTPSGFPTDVCNGTLQIFQPDASLLVEDGPCIGVGLYFELTQTGSHRIVLDPFGINAGSIIYQLESVEDLPDQEITVDGPPVSLTFESGQNATLTFDGTVGQQVNLVTTVNDNLGCGVGLSFFAPGSPDRFKFINCPFPGFDEPLGPLPATGTYTIFVDPAGWNTGTLAFRLASG